MNLTIVESTANPDRLWIVESSTPTVPFGGTDCLYESQITRKLAILGSDRDHLLVSALKILSGNLKGFASWGDAAAFLVSIPDVEAAAIEYGTTIETLIYNGR